MAVNYPVHMPDDLFVLVKASADREGVSAAEWIRRAIRERLEPASAASRLALIHDVMVAQGKAGKAGR